MNGSTSAALLRTLRRLARPPQAPRQAERCELCGLEISSDHTHLVDVHARRLLCACPICGEIHSAPLAGSARYKAVSRRYVRFPAPLAASEWARLTIPVDLAFLFFNSALNRMIAFYPGPAGATESLLPLDRWSALAAANPWLTMPAADIEALLVRKVDEAYECALVPIDACYGLVGRIRAQWTGMTGGDAVQREIAAFFETAVERSRPESLRETASARTCP